MTDSVEVDRSPMEAYSRRMDDATTVIRFGKEYPGGGEAEFDALSRLYSVDPVHVAKPINLNRDLEGKVIGFEMERVNGQTVREYLEVNGSVPPHVVEQVREALRKFHESGLAHGDITMNNVFIGLNGEIKIIDPVGYGYIPQEDFQKYADLDMEAISTWV